MTIVRRVLQVNGEDFDSLRVNEMFLDICTSRAFGKAYPDTVDEIFTQHWFVFVNALWVGAGVDIATAGNPGSRSPTWTQWASMD